MKTLKKSNLDELAEIMPIIEESEQTVYIGGSGTGIYGSNTYSVYEFETLCASGNWYGGYVQGWGYTGPEAMITGRPKNINSTSDVYRNSDSGGQWSMMYEGGYQAGFTGGVMNTITGALSGIAAAAPGESGPQWDLLYFRKGYERGVYDRENGYNSYY